MLYLRVRACVRMCVCACARVSTWIAVLTHFCCRCAVTTPLPPFRLRQGRRSGCRHCGHRVHADVLHHHPQHARHSQARRSLGEAARAMPHVRACVCVCVCLLHLPHPPTQFLSAPPYLNRLLFAFCDCLLPFILLSFLVLLFFCSFVLSPRCSGRDSSSAIQQSPGFTLLFR